MLDPNTGMANNRISQLLGTIFILIVVSTLIAVLNEGAWHELGMNVTGGLIVLLVAVFIADQLIQKYNEERFDPHREYIYATLQRAVTEAFVAMIPPLTKSQLQRAEFGAYSEGYFELLELYTTQGVLFANTYGNSCNNIDELKRAITVSRASVDSFMDMTRSLRHQFFTLLDPTLLECLLRLEDAHSDLDIVIGMDHITICPDNDLEFTARLYSQNLMQLMVLS